MVKVAMIGHKDFPSRSGGVEVMVGGLARSLVERGYDVTVYNRGLEKHHNVYDVDGVHARRVFTLQKPALNATIYSFYVVGDPLKELYSNCGLFVLPSHTEGLSLSLLEALSIGARCLVSDIPENTVVTDIYGAAFKPEDTDDLARALERECTQEYPDAMRQQQIQYIHTNFEYDVMLDRYEEVYHHVVGDPLKAMPSTLKKGRVPAGAKA